MDVNLFGSDVEHPWLDLACTVKTIQLQDEEDRRAGAPTRNEKYFEQFQQTGDAQAFAEACTGFFKAAFEPCSLRKSARQPDVAQSATSN